MPRALLALLGLALLVLPVLPQPEPKPYVPKIAPASKEAELAIGRFKLPAGFTATVWAAEPLLANPVAFCFDEQGRCYVAETYRLHDGVIDIRNHMNWLDDDLACRTVADRVAFMKRRMKNFDKTDDHPDRVVRLADTKGKGVADQSIVVSDDFRTSDAGLGSGVLARGNTLWFTNIPSLWKLTLGPDGKATKQEALSTGFGVHFGFIGHDLHGLTMGPDGKLYFSIGDRGANVIGSSGSAMNPDSGAVFRCNPDGSELELFATGLRNPQELAFDDYGNLFTGDNNCDAGDRARITYVMDGGDHGWRIGWQFFEQPRPRAAWMSEGMWDPKRAPQSAYLVPPIVNLTAGPSGLVYDPGIGLPEQYRGSFYVCDFHGGSKGSGIVRFRLEPQGAGFKPKDHEEFITNVLATDVDFGPDGAMYILDWTEGWNKPNKGRIYRFSNPKLSDRIVAETAELLRSDLTKRETQDLVPLLGHADRRVRQAAQFALVELSLGRVPGVALDALMIPPAISLFAQSTSDPKAKAQALMTLAMVAKHEPIQAEGLVTALADGDPNIRAVAARGLGTTGLRPTALRLIPLLKDKDARVRAAACQSLGRLKAKNAVQGILAMLKENNDQDPFLRAAGYIALARIADAPGLHAAIKDDSPAVRRAVCVALRRLADPKIAEFLTDADPSIVKEAARAICDVPIPEAYPALAKLIDAKQQPDLTWYATLNANFILGGPEHAAAVTKVAARADLPELVRFEAMEMLAAWAKPNGKDRFTGLWRPLPSRADVNLVEAIQLYLPDLFIGSDRLVTRGVKLVGELKLTAAEEKVARLLAEQKGPTELRELCLRTLTRLKSARLPGLVSGLLRDGDPKVRAAAQRALVDLDPKQALAVLSSALEQGSVVEKQSALAALGELPGDEATALLKQCLAKLQAGQLPPECALDLLDAYRKRACPDKERLLAEHRAVLLKRSKELGEHLDCLVGGDAERGRAVFLKQDLMCVKCHKLGGEGGEVGPDLSKIGADKNREYLLEAIVKPNAQIAKGFDSVVILATDGKLHTGVLKSEDEKEVRLVNADGKEAKTIVIAKNKIEERQAGKSPMPEDIMKNLSPHELRDLIEFLATRK